MVHFQKKIGSIFFRKKGQTGRGGGPRGVWQKATVFPGFFSASFPIPLFVKYFVLYHPCPCLSRYDTTSRYTSSYDSGRESPASPYSVGRSVTSPTLGRLGIEVSIDIFPSGAAPPLTALGFPPITHVGIVASSWKRRRMKAATRCRIVSSESRKRINAV